MIHGVCDSCHDFDVNTLHGYLLTGMLTPGRTISLCSWGGGGGKGLGSNSGCHCVSLYADLVSE